LDDHILRVTAGNGGALAFIATTRLTVDTAATLHRTSPVATAALGRLLTAAAVMGTALKNDGDLLTLQIKGDGTAGGLVATSDRLARVKGYPLNGGAELPLKPDGKLDVAGALGRGSLYVIKDMGLKEPYVGISPLVSGEIAEDLAYYFATSEQIPSAVGLGVLVDTNRSVRQAGGFFVQLLPGADNALIDNIERSVKRMGMVTSFYDAGNTTYDMAGYLFKDIGYNVNEKIPVSYYCNCSRERVEKALFSLGKDELVKILAEDKRTSLHCHFCQKDYCFDERALRSIINGL